ncbi:MAG: LarC family nickel insertion protein [Betaproteobacteria bacterium]|nr:LarC family nickel insertion protein [Betaproteobacteria bacterium]
MLIHLDPVGGIAGDMFIAAVTDAFPQLREGMLTAIRAAGLPEDIDCRFEPHEDHSLTGSRFIVDIPGQGDSYVPVVPAEGHLLQQGAHAPHTHRDFADIRTHLLASTLTPEVKHHAIGIFTVLAGAESKIHGHPVDDVSFHELGEWDSVADIVGAAYLITALDATEWTIGTLPLGSGFVRTAHGRLPVPVPAAAAILEGYAFIDDGVEGERITPTGAAIVRHLACHQQRHSRSPSILRHNGYGFGTRRFPGMANVLRLLAFEPQAARTSLEDSEAAVIEFDVDDQTPEDLAIGLDRIRSLAGVLDVLQMPAYGKKGRVAAHVQVLTEPEALARAVEACFLETTTIGLRYHTVHRHRLPREMKVVQVGNHSIRVKIAHRADSVTAKADSDDALHSRGAAGRMQTRHDAETSGLDGEEERSQK